MADDSHTAKLARLAFAFLSSSPYRRTVAASTADFAIGISLHNRKQMETCFYEHSEDFYLKKLVLLIDRRHRRLSES